MKPQPLRHLPQPSPGRDAVPVSLTLRDGREVTLRESRPSDAPGLLALHAGLSPATRHARYFTAGGTKRAADAERLAAATSTGDHVLVAVTPDDAQIVAVGELARFGNAAEAALVVRDDYQNAGLGGQVFPRLLEAAADLGLRQVEVSLLSGNARIQQIVHRHGPRVRRSESGVVQLVIDLAPAAHGRNLPPAA